MAWAAVNNLIFGLGLRGLTFKRRRGVVVFALGALLIAVVLLGLLLLHILGINLD